MERGHLLQCLRRKTFISNAPTPQEQMRQILAVMEPLREIAKRRIIHRDLKPENILISDSGRVAYADFSQALTTAEILAMDCGDIHWGTRDFQAPEARDPSCQLGPSLDVYAMGVTLEEINLSDGIHPIIRSILDPIIEKARRVDPRERLQNGAEFYASLQEAATSLCIS